MTVSGIAGRLRARGRAPGGWALALPVLLLLAPFLLWPLGAVLWRSFAPEHAPERSQPIVSSGRCVWLARREGFEPPTLRSEV